MNTEKLPVRAVRLTIGLQGKVDEVYARID